MIIRCGQLETDSKYALCYFPYETKRFKVNRLRRSDYAHLYATVSTEKGISLFVCSAYLRQANARLCATVSAQVMCRGLQAISGISCCSMLLPYESETLSTDGPH